MAVAAATVRHRRLRRVAAGAALFGLLLRALIPLGYMPGNLLAGELMVLCPTALPSSVIHALHLHHDHHAATTAVEADRDCPIGTALKYAAAPGGVEPVVDIDTAQIVYRLPTTACNDVKPRQRFRARAPPTARV